MGGPSGVRVCRAPDGFDRIEDIFAPGELEAISARYKALTGLKRASESRA